MPVAAAVMVGPADVRVRRGHVLLTCLGVRCGACLGLYDSQVHVAGMAHVTDSEADELHPCRPGKFASSALEALIQSMERAGASRNRLKAVVIGGAEISLRDGESDSDPLVLDAGIGRAVILELNRQGIEVVAEDVGGKIDRTVLIDVAHGIVTVKTTEGDKVLADLRAQPLRELAA